MPWHGLCYSLDVNKTNKEKTMARYRGGYKNAYAMYYLGGEVTNAQRLAELEKESAVKKVTKRDAHRIGF